MAFAWVATGRLSAGAYLKQDKIWDYVPGEFLVEQAGGKSFDERGIHIAANKAEWLEALKEAVSNSNAETQEYGSCLALSRITRESLLPSMEDATIVFPLATQFHVAFYR